MIHQLFFLLQSINEFVWGYLAFFLIVALGIYFTFRSRSFQFVKFPTILKNFLSGSCCEDKHGIHPMKIFFTAFAGSIGIGNIVGICTAIEIGGPGALFWTWIAGLLGTLLLYGEVYLGMVYRVRNNDGGYDGGPMYFLQKAFKKKWMGFFVSIFLCLYGTDLFIFNVVTESITKNWNLNKFYVVAALIILVFLATKGGIQRVTKICISLLPLFLIAYLGMSGWIFCKNLSEIPRVFGQIFQGAFTAQGAIGGFAGSTVALTISMGMSRGAYAGEIGIGYNSILHSESKSTHPGRQAALTMIGLLINTFVLCSFSTILVLTTGTWTEGIESTLMIQNALGKYFPAMHLFFPFFLFLLGYLTMITAFIVGLKSAKFISPNRGKKLYFVYGTIFLPLFAFIGAKEAFIFMSLSGAVLLILNLSGIFLLRKEIRFHLD